MKFNTQLSHNFSSYSFITTCKKQHQREWEIQKNGRNVQSAAKLCTTGLPGTDTCAYILVHFIVYPLSSIILQCQPWLSRCWFCIISTKRALSFFHFLCFQVKNPILVAFVVDVSERITTSSATRRNVRTDTPELSCNPPRRTAPVWCPAWSTDNVRPPPLPLHLSPSPYPASNNLNTAVKSIQLTRVF